MSRAVELNFKSGGRIYVPQSNSTAEVRMINTTTNVVCPTDFFLEPVIKGLEHLNLPTYAFLVENRRLDKVVLFDLGCRKDWWNLAPVVQASIRQGIKGLEVTKGINEILEEGGFPLDRINSIVLSHSHLDHIGDPSLFPLTTELVVGPGFKSAFLPGYPSNPNAVVLESDFANGNRGRKVREVEFNEKQNIGQFRSYDFWGDGSLYLIDVPGHSEGHICALVRTTEDTFIFLGGDVCHFAGAIRPSPSTLLPNTITPDLLNGSRISTPCHCSIFTACHPENEKARSAPYYHVTTKTPSWYVDQKAAQESVNGVMELDADENIFVALAHDVGLIEVVEWFPEGRANDWKAKAWKERSRWGFLNELPMGKDSVKPFV